MKRRCAVKARNNAKEKSKEVITVAKTRDVGANLLKDNELLPVKSIDTLGNVAAKQHGYDGRQFIFCEVTELREKLSPHKEDNNNEKPIFIVLHDQIQPTAVLCVVEMDSTTFCLYKNILNVQIPEDVKNILKEHFGEDVVFKLNDEKVEMGVGENLNMSCLMTLTTLFENLKHDKRKDFIGSYESSWKGLNAWLAGGVAAFKEQLFSLMKEGYYKTFASDIDKLERDTEFKNKLNEFFNSIPMIEEFDNFKKYQNLLKEFVEMEDDEIDAPDVTNKIKNLEEARKKAFDNIEQMKLVKNDSGHQELSIVKEFPTQMEMFTKIFEPLTKSEVDSTLDEILKEISSKLNLDNDKLKSFFQAKEEKAKSDTVNVCISRSIEEVMKEFPKIETNTAILDDSIKPLDQLLSELTLETADESNVKVSLREGHDRVKHAYELWENANAVKIHEWATSKKRKLADAEVYEALAVMDRANELVTGGHRLRDAQLLSLLTFLLQKDKGLLSQIRTGEGKTTIVSFLAAVKALQGQCVDIITSNPVLASDGVREKQNFYAMLNLSVSTNNVDENYKSGGRDCYRANVVYGSISNFQFDYLKDSFLGLSTRNGRMFECIILDEVDSMIIDNASHIAKLSGPFPGMECLKYIYIKIWQELHKAVEKIEKEFPEKMKKKSELMQSEGLSDLEAQAEYEEYLEKLKASVIPTITEHIKSSEPTKICILPSHIQQYADDSLDRWISSAIDAKYTYCEDEQYIIRHANGERVVQPVDYSNTGITLKNTIWQYGLHQFLQLKHNLHLTYESLTSCFISNLGYINKYGHKIFGLTGTLGSKAEQELLSSIYDVSYSRIPTYKRRELIEIGGKVVDDDDFFESLVHDALSEVESSRSSLIICETIKDAKRTVQALLRKNEKVIIKTYFNEEDAHITKDKISPGEVVIATNIAGRGTDFRTSSELEDNGGLQVCVAFLPGNKRVEDQAFGRTARQGNKGTAKLVIKRSELENLALDCDNFEEIKAVRDEKEVSRICHIKKVKIIELNFQDEIFEEFSSLYRKLKRRVEDENEYTYALDDLKEFWAFWLESKQFNGPELGNKSPGKEFEDFKTKAREVIDGEIKFNPYYSIQQAEHFIVNDNLVKAEKALEHAIEISKNPDILHSAYMKLFEIAIEKGNVFMVKIKKAVTDLFPMKMVEPDREYKEKAKKYLGLAREALKKELDYIESMIKNEDFTNIIKGDSDDIDKSDLSYWYDDEDMNAVGKTILAPLGVDVNHQFVNRLTKDLIENFCKEFQLKDQRPILICYNQGGRSNEVGGIHWVALCVVKIKDRLKVMFKDSKGVSNVGIADEFKKFHRNVDLVHHTGCEQHDDSSCGPLTLQNLRIMAKSIKENGLERFVASFPTLKFSQQQDVSVLRNEFADVLPNEPRNAEENLFVKHIISKQHALMLNMGHTESLIQQIDNHSDDISVNSRISDYLSNLKSPNDDERNLKRIIADFELTELAALGMNTMYALREIHDICPQIVNGARVQIGGGIALIATGICFPPALPVTSSIGGTMITEGLCDLAFELMNQNRDGKFNKKAYIKGKVISYGISLLTLGISAALQCPKILNAAKNACRWVSATLRKCPYLINVCEYVATHFDKLANWFEKLETIAMFNRMTQAEKLAYAEKLKKAKDLKRIQYLGNSLTNISRDLTHLEKVRLTMKQTAICVTTGVAKSIAVNVIMNRVVLPLLNVLMSNLKSTIKENVEKAVRSIIDKDKLKSHTYEDVQKIMTEISNSIDLETVKGIFKETIIGMGKYCSNWKVQLCSLAVDQIISLREVYNYAVDWCKKINKALAKSSESGGDGDNVDELLIKLIEQLSEDMYVQLLNATGKACKDAYFVGRSANSNYSKERKRTKTCMDMNRGFKEGGLAGQEQAEALSDVIKRPIHIYEENGNVIVIGGQYVGEPIQVSYYPAGDGIPEGHYVPYGENRDWSSGTGGESNCLFDSVGSQIGQDSNMLRGSTLRQIEKDPTRYMAYEVESDDVRLLGGKIRQHQEEFSSSEADDILNKSQGKSSQSQVDAAKDKKPPKGHPRLHTIKEDNEDFGEDGIDMNSDEIASCAENFTKHHNCSKTSFVSTAQQNSVTNEVLKLPEVQDAINRLNDGETEVALHIPVTSLKKNRNLMVYNVRNGKVRGDKVAVPYITVVIGHHEGTMDIPNTKPHIKTIYPRKKLPKEK